MNDGQLDTRDRRILREVNYIRNNKDYKNISINYNDSNNMYLDIKTKKGNVLHFNISKEHPFKPPTLEIQTTNGSYNYRERLNTMPSSVYYYLQYPNEYYIKNNTKHNENTQNREYICLCCTSSLCHANWTPVIRLTYIIQEIEDNNNIKQIIGYKISLNYLFKTNNIPVDLIKPIIEFLQ
jgi:hypothetical protein